MTVFGSVAPLAPTKDLEVVWDPPSAVPMCKVTLPLVPDQLLTVWLEPWFLVLAKVHTPTSAVPTGTDPCCSASVPAVTETYTLSLPDALPISMPVVPPLSLKQLKVVA